MSVFVVIAASNANAVGQAVTAQYGANHYKFADNAWFVPDTGTTTAVADKLGISNGRVGAFGAVMRFDAYSGWAPAAGWAWIESHGGAISNG